MLKFTSHLTNSNLFLIRRQLGDGTCAAMVVMGPTRRYATRSSKQFENKCPEPLPPKKSRKLLFSAVTVTMLTGAAVYYAKSSKDTRNWLETNAPWANDVICVVFQEKESYWQFTSKQLSCLATTISNFMFGKEGVTPMEFKNRSEQDLEKEVHVAFAPKNYVLPPPILEPLYREKAQVSTPEIEQEATLVRTEKCVPVKKPPVVVTKDIVELEKDMQRNTKTAVEQYKEAVKLCKAYNKTVFKVIETDIEGAEPGVFNAVKGARGERDNVAAMAAKAAATANCAIENLDRMIRDGTIQVPPTELTVTKRFIKQFREDIAQQEREYKAELDKSVLADAYWSKVEEARNKYKFELQALFPNLDICARKLVVSDTDLLLVYTMRQVQFLQNQLAELQTVRDLKIQRAIECHDEKELIEAKVLAEISKARLEKEEEYLRKVLIIEAEAARKMKDALKKQYEIQTDVLQAKLSQREKEIMGQFNKVVSEQLEAERLNFKKDLAAMAAKLQAIEATLKQRSASEAEGRRSQSLWAAAEALLATLRAPGSKKSIDKEIAALEDAGKGDKLVQTVIESIKPEIRKKGIVTEKTLKAKFDEVEKTTYKVALIGRDGASLPMYFLSWLQSKVLFQKLAEIPKDELENQPTDFTKLDTFDIMQRARYYIDHDKLAHALRYVNLLSGAPRAAARAWLAAARDHLEVRQAAEAVMAHASLSGMQH